MFKLGFRRFLFLCGLMCFLGGFLVCLHQFVNGWGWFNVGQVFDFRLHHEHLALSFWTAGVLLVLWGLLWRRRG